MRFTKQAQDKRKAKIETRANGQHVCGESTFFYYSLPFLVSFIFLLCVVVYTTFNINAGHLWIVYNDGKPFTA